MTVLPRLLFAGLVLLTPTTAFADAIDGHWCHKDGRRLTINGPQIITPGGRKMAGAYDRHGFSYIIPPKEPGAGKRMIMNQLNDQTIAVRNGPHGPKAVKQIWKRCGRPAA